MIRLRFIFLAAVLVVSTVAPVQGQVAEREGSQWVVRSVQQLEANKLSAVMVDQFTGTIQIRGTSGSSVVITDEIWFDRDSRSQAEREAKRIAPEATFRGTSLLITGRHSDSVEAREIVIEVPSHIDIDLDSPAGNAIVQEIKGDVDIGTGAGNVYVNGVGGTLRIRSGAGTVSVKGVRLETRIRTGGGEVRVEDVSALVNVVTGGGDVSMLEVLGDIDVTTGGGNVSVENAGGDVNIYTGGGNIEISGLKGKANLSTSGGDIEMNDVEGAIQATTNGGEIEGVRLMSSIQIETMAGDIDLRETHSSIRARSEVGDISIHVAQNGLGQEERIEVRASHGDVEISLPASLGARVTADAGANGEVEIESGAWDLALGERRFGRDRSLRRVEFLIGGGGGTIILESNWGDIEIRAW